MSLPTWDSLTIGVGSVSIDVEAVTDPAVGRQPRAEADHRKQLVGVVLLDDVPDRLNRRLILIGHGGPASEIVQGPENVKFT